MDTTEQAARLTNIVEKNRHFENLLSNEDFLKWRDESVEARLEAILDSVKTADRSKPDWRDRVCDAVVAYQEANLTYKILFGMAETAATKAREQMQELSKAQG